MGFGDRLKELRDQAQQAVAENKDKIQGAVQAVGQVANERTEGRYADKIAKVGERVSEGVERLAAPDAEVEHPAGEHPAGEHPAGERPAGEQAPQPPVPDAHAPATPPEFE